MGCDIHMVLEQKVDGKWLGIDAYRNWMPAQTRQANPTDRNYKRFHQLANVRGRPTDEDGPDPKGVPDDISSLTQLMLKRWEGDGHSHSWISLPDAIPIFLATEWFDIEHQSDYAKQYPASYFFNIEHDPLDLDQYRLVFWFDN